MMVDCVVIEGEEELKDYTPGVYAKSVLESAEAHGSKRQRWESYLGPIQAVRDDAGKWHFWPGT